MHGGKYVMADTSEQIRSDLSTALSRGQTAEAETLMRQALDAGADPLDLIQNLLVPTLTQVGQDFQEFKIFLPELMAAGEAAQAATAILEEAIAESGAETQSPGTVVLGTVENDVHDIGKNIVNTMLSSHGFKVVDIGRDVSPSKFLETAQHEKADIVAMSALMTTTRPATRSTINLFSEVGVRQQFKIVVGGGCIDQAWADEIGADGYAPDAAGAVDLCKKLLTVIPE
jgi:5-methyltetrahydrofolate--homocysteine methyltransferase